jgi:hypothetical protein
VPVIMLPHNFSGCRGRAQDLLAWSAR